MFIDNEIHIGIYILLVDGYIQLYYLYKTSAFIAIKHVNILMHFTFYYNCLNLNSLKSDSIVYTAVEKPNFFFYTK